MGNQVSQNIPPLILKSWQKVNQNQDIFQNKLTSQFVRQHYAKIQSPTKLEELKSRIKQANMYICRVAFLYHYSDDFYYIYTDQNRNKPLVNNPNEWNAHKERIVQAFIILSRRYQPTNVCKEMIGVDFHGQIKVWIHPDPISHKVWSPCSSQAQMINDILRICDQISQESKKNTIRKKCSLRNFDETPSTPSSYLAAKKRASTQTFNNLNLKVGNNKIFTIKEENIEFKDGGQSKMKNNQSVSNFKNIKKPRDFTTPCTPQHNLTTSQQNNSISWDTIGSNGFDDYFIGGGAQENDNKFLQEEEKPQPKKSVVIDEKGKQKTARLRKLSSCQTYFTPKNFKRPMQANQNEEDVPKKDKYFLKKDNMKQSWKSNQSSENQNSKMQKKTKYMQYQSCNKSREKYSHSKQKKKLESNNLVLASSLRIKVKTEKNELNNILKNELGKILQLPGGNDMQDSQQENNEAQYSIKISSAPCYQHEHLFNEQERKEYIRAQQLIKQKKQHYRSFQLEINKIIS